MCKMLNKVLFHFFEYIVDLAALRAIYRFSNAELLSIYGMLELVGVFLCALVLTIINMRFSPSSKMH